MKITTVQRIGWSFSQCQWKLKVDRPHHHLRQAERTAELAHQAGGVKGRPAREPGALAQHDVVPPESREPVEDRAPTDAAADHDRTRSALHPTEPNRVSLEDANEARCNRTSFESL